MKLSRFAKVALAAALVAPAGLSAQATQALTFNGPNSTQGDRVGSFVTGAYSVTPTMGGSAFDVFCIDADNPAQAGSFTAHYVTFQEAVGIYSTQAQRQLGTGWDITHLRAAAYLSTQFGAVGPTQSDDNWDDTHGAIWSMFSGNGQFSGYTGAAAAAIAIAGGNAGWDNDYVLVLDDRAFDANYRGALMQGFITEDGNTTIRVVTPEPGTYALMGAGLLVVGFVSRRRRSV